MRLTDGKTTVKALEIKRLPSIDAKHLPPGTKVHIANAVCKCGCILLEPKCFKASQTFPQPARPHALLSV